MDPHCLRPERACGRMGDVRNAQAAVLHRRVCGHLLRGTLCGSENDKPEMRDLTNAAPAPNRRPRFPLGSLVRIDYHFCAPSPSPAAAGEARRSAYYDRA